VYPFPESYTELVAYGYLVGAPVWKAKRRGPVYARDVAASVFGGILYSAYLVYGLEGAKWWRDYLLGSIIHNNAVLMISLEEKYVYREIKRAAVGTPIEEEVIAVEDELFPLEALLPRLSGAWKPTIEAARRVAPSPFRQAADRLSALEAPPEPLSVLVNELASYNRDVIRTRILARVLGAAN